MLYTINNISVELEIIIIKFSCIFKMMARNTFPEPQPDNASYQASGRSIRLGTIQCNVFLYDEVHG